CPRYFCPLCCFPLTQACFTDCLPQLSTVVNHSSVVDLGVWFEAEVILLLPPVRFLSDAVDGNCLDTPPLCRSTIIRLAIQKFCLRTKMVLRKSDAIGLNQGWINRLTRFSVEAVLCCMPDVTAVRRDGLQETKGLALSSLLRCTVYFEDLA